MRNSDLEPEVSAAIAPDSAEQAQAIVRVANRHLVPLHPISTGKNLGYGGSSPILPESVVLDLKRMNRILNVDTSNHTMLVELGVPFMGSFYGNLPMYWTKRVGAGLANWAVSTDPEANRRTREQYIAMTQICCAGVRAAWCVEPS